MFQFLTRHSVRWEDLSLLLTSDLVPLLGTLRDRYPLLRRLSIRWQGQGSQEGMEFFDCFPMASSLFDIGMGNQFRHIHIPLPAHQLTRYNLDAPWPVHETLLKLAQNLVEAWIKVSFDDDKAWPIHTSILDLLRLQRLFVSHLEVLRYLRASALPEIIYNLCSREEAELHSDLDAFLMRSSFTLRRLGFYGPPNADTTVRILEKYPSVAELVTMYNPQSQQPMRRHLRINHPSSQWKTGAGPTIIEDLFQFQR
jgi:hypothetical protein